jgi:UDP-N-acetylglucosamine transferase subunit ALG13
MILVTVGTHEAPFDRLLEAVGRLGVDEDLVVQHGSSLVRPAGAKCIPYLPYDELWKLVGDARVVVCHAGVGSIMTALAREKKPIVVPRSYRLGEHVDDHQLELCRRLAHEGMVVLVEDEQQLGAALSGHDNERAASFRRPGRLEGELRSLLELRIRRMRPRE